MKRPLPKEIVLDNGMKFEKTYRRSTGKGELKDITWHKYVITNHEDFDMEYDAVILSFFKITEEERKNASKSIINGGVSTAARPHIDGKTGNIHPTKEYVEEQGKEIIKQLVLCRGQGPNTPQAEISNDYYVNCVRVHKACYYPLIKEEPALTEDYRYMLLEMLWNKLGEKIGRAHV